MSVQWRWRWAWGRSRAVLGLHECLVGFSFYHADAWNRSLIVHCGVGQWSIQWRTADGGYAAT